MPSRTVTVVIPTYNRADLLEEALVSVAQQSVPPTEVIVVDDGSTDNTEAVMASPGAGVRYIRQANAGPATARNVGLSNATSEFIALLDSDDLWPSDRLARQHELLDRSPHLDVVFGLEAKFSGRDSASDRLEIRDEVVRATLMESPGIVARAFDLLLRENFIPTSSVLLRRSQLSRLGLMDSTVEPAEDYDLWLRFAEGGCQFGFINNVLCFRRIHDGNLVRQWLRLAEAGATVLARYCDRPGRENDAAKRRLGGLYYDIGSRLFREGQFSRANKYLQWSRVSGKSRVALTAKRAIASLLARDSVRR
jgi:glycosyltransferase involved in cell wall biosynthesis